LPSGGSSLKHLRQQLRQLLSENERLKLFVNLESPSTESAESFPLKTDSLPSHGASSSDSGPSGFLPVPAVLPSHSQGASFSAADSPSPAVSFIDQTDSTLNSSQPSSTLNSQTLPSEAAAILVPAVASDTAGDPSVSDIEYLTSDNDAAAAPPHADSTVAWAPAPAPETHKATD
jgi:hypothetical protein